MLDLQGVNETDAFAESILVLRSKDVRKFRIYQIFCLIYPLIKPVNTK